MSEHIIAKAKAELYAAIVQSIDSDDQIIMNHVRAAYNLLRAIEPHVFTAGGTGDAKDTCQLCGLDLRDDLHVRSKVPA
ncbi:hypothetical protein LCGC14_1642460 [marine sediment metagenome]|uniref:Uncharacterized protein n=1 Tax=marine sediment metagenome TaxID=412755 RepID=A0A0F9HZX8_9ZZZZ